MAPLTHLTQTIEEKIMAAFTEEEIIDILIEERGEGLPDEEDRRKQDNEILSKYLNKETTNVA